MEKGTRMRNHASVLSTLTAFFCAVQPWALAQEPLCGINSVYTAATLIGIEAKFADLLQPKFVGSDRGSSLAELEKAAGKLGLHYLSVSRLSTTDLRHSKLPVILHVKTDLASSNYNHFVLFGGYRDGRAIIYDGTNEPMQWTLGEVASRWDGNALVLSKTPISLWDLTAPSRWSIIAWGCAIAGGQKKGTFYFYGKVECPPFYRQLPASSRCQRGAAACAGWRAVRRCPKRQGILVRSHRRRCEPAGDPG
jgi:hypothetical protein